MPTPRPWTVLPHGPLVRLEENLHLVEGEVPAIPGLRRTMAVVRRTDGALLFYNAVPVDEPTLAAVRALGAPRFLLVPHHLHTFDAHAFRERLGLEVYAPASTRALTEARVKVTGAFEALPADPALSVVTVAGFKTGEGLALVRSGARVSLVVGDLVVNTPHLPGLAGLLFRLMGMTGERPRLPVPVRLRVLRDRRALRAQLEALAATPGLCRIVPSHGPVVEHDPAGALRAIAARV